MYITIFSPVTHPHNGDVFGCRKPIYQQWTRCPRRSIFIVVHTEETHNSV